MARALSQRDGPFLFFDSGKGVGESCIFSDPVEVWTAADGALDEWMRREQAAGRWVAGVLSFELAWELDTVRGAAAPVPYPTAWVGSFSEREGWREPVEGSAALPPLAEDVWSPRMDITREAYEANVQASIDAIFAGELFEVNYTERFRTGWKRPAFELFERMRSTATGSFFGFAQLGDVAVASVSPEEFLRVDARQVLTRPIKGTMRRELDPTADEAARASLAKSEKDRAENVMIVDLMRNDLTRWCVPGTVRATEICAVETFAGWHHLVSTVEGVLEPNVSATDLLLGSFPPGSITGAPKLRAIELIAELEASPRGAYTGTMFWAGEGRLRSNVLIRTAVIHDEVAEYGAGGAIVADSIPATEYEEALLKARPFLEAGT